MLLKILSSTAIALIVLLLIVAIRCCIYFLKYYRYWEKRGVPVEQNYLLVNDLHTVFSGKKNFSRFLEHIYKRHDEPYFGFYILGKPHLFIRNPQLVKNITIRDCNYFENRSFACNEEVDPIVAKSVFLAKHAQWKKTRAKLNMLFSPAKIKSLVPTITDLSKKMQDYLETRDNEIVDFKDVGETLVTNLGPLTFLGINSHCSFSEEDNTIKTSIKNVFGRGWYQGLAFFSYICMPKLVPLLNIQLANYGFLKKAAQDMISYKETNTVKGKEISDVLVNTIDQSNDKINGNFFDENWLISQALSLIVGGFIQPASLFSLTLYELSLKADFQDKLRKEISETFPAEEEPTYEIVNKMKYLHMVISETLRKHPLGGFVNRICTRNYLMEETSLKIEQGTPILISIDAMHVDPNHFPNPYQFDPERFKDGTKDLENAGVYTPFGAGQRRCLGERFTNTAIKMALVYVLRKFRLEPCHLTEKEVEMDPVSISSTPLNGIKLRIHKL